MINDLKYRESNQDHFDTYNHLNVIYFTSVTQKAHGTYIGVLKGAGTGIMWLHMVQETRKSRKTTNHGQVTTTLTHA